MSVSQISTPLSIDVSHLPRAVGDALSALVSQCTERMGAGAAPTDFEADENWVLSSVMSLGRALLQGRIEALDDGAPNGIRAGRLWHRVDPTPHTIMTLLGPVRYERARYRRDGESASWVPVDESLGLVDGYLTGPAARLAAYAAGCCPPREAAELFARMGGMTPSVSTLQRLPGGLHENWERGGAAALERIREEEGVPEEAVSAVISLDGVMVPLRAGEEGCEKAGWREAACGTIAYHDRKGKRLDTNYFGRMPETGKTTLKASLEAELAWIRGERPDLVVVAVADGAVDNWNYLGTLDTDAEAVDYWHACQHLRVVGEHAKAEGWYKKHAEILRTDPEGVEKVIRAIRYLHDVATAGAEDLARELEFFRKNRRRMRYQELRDRKLSIGSGIVEAANKVLVTQRLKRSGMRWRIEGGQAILTLRALIKSGRFDRAWSTLIGAPKPANDNQNPRYLAIAA